VGSSFGVFICELFSEELMEMKNVERKIRPK